MPPELHPHPKQKDGNQADAYGNQYLWLQSEPTTFKETAEDGCTNDEPHRSHIGPYDKENNCPYASWHGIRIVTAETTKEDEGVAPTWGTH